MDYSDGMTTEAVDKLIHELYTKQYPEVTPTPCSECPWRRSATPGYLGPHDAEEWIQIAHAEGPIACHLTCNGDAEWSPEVRQCAGAARFRANVHKKPRNSSIVTGPQDHKAVFSSNIEFIEHHQ